MRILLILLMTSLSAFSAPPKEVVELDENRRYSIFGKVKLESEGMLTQLDVLNGKSIKVKSSNVLSISEDPKKITKPLFQVGSSFIILGEKKIDLLPFINKINEKYKIKRDDDEFVEVEGYSFLKVVPSTGEIIINFYEFENDIAYIKFNNRKLYLKLPGNIADEKLFYF